MGCKISFCSHLSEEAKEPQKKIKNDVLQIYAVAQKRIDTGVKWRFPKG